jgi:hypothetical protein
MISQCKTQYPHHLARLVAERLRADFGRSIPETVLVRFLETLYFTSLKTEEGRRVMCMVTYLEPEQLESSPASRRVPDQWICARFASPLPFDVRNLAKLAQAADPAVSSLAVSSDAKHRLFVCGIIDQEPRYADAIFTDCPSAAARPGLFQAAITGPGNISVYRQGVLVGSLVQNALVEQCHNVLWSGPVREMLAGDLRNAVPVSDHEILFRWLNAISRILVAIRQYRRGGGLVVVADRSLSGMNVHYRLKYDRLLPSLVALVHESRSQNLLAGAVSPAAMARQIDKHKAEVFGAIRFVSALARVDGIVALDCSLGVQGFGAELRSDNPLANVFAAGDAMATEALLRKVDMASFGTRHRAVMRYCSDHGGSLGFVVSHDGDIQAMSRIGPRLVIWENIDVQLALFQETRHNAGPDRAAVLRPLVSRPE